MIHSLEAEQGLIGGLMLAGDDSFQSITGLVSAGDFYRAEHRAIFGAITKLSAKREPFDPITLCDVLGSELNEAGGRGYIFDLMSEAPSTANIEAYARIVRDKSLERGLLARCSEIIEFTQEAGGAEEKIAKAQALLSTLEAQESDLNEYDDFDKWLGREAAALKSGFFDKETGGLGAWLWILAAGTGQGKTTLALNIASYVLGQGAPVAVYSYEMSNAEVLARMVSNRAQVPYWKIRDRNLHPQEFNEVVQAKKKLKEQGLRVSDRTLNIDHLCAHIRQSHRKHGIQLAIVDYIQLVPSGGHSREREVADISRKLKLVQRDLSIPIIGLSQLSRAHETRTNPRPRNADLRESGAIEQDADVVLFMFDEAKYSENSLRKGITELYSGKFRHGENFEMFLDQDLQTFRFTPRQAPVPQPASQKRVYQLGE